MLAKKRIEDYWKLHRDKKIALESEKQSLIQQIAAINKELTETDEYVGMVQLQKEVKNLESEMLALGILAFLFKRKEMKEIHGQINSAKAEITRKQAWINNAKTEKIAPLESRVNEIDTELSKPR